MSDDSDARGDRPVAKPRIRPLNTRPRDALGRPLPYGSTGVPGPVTGVDRGAAESVRQAQRLLDDGLPFHAHEVLEDAWRFAEADERELWRALAQLAAGCTHAARGNPVGAAALWRRAAAGLSAYENRPTAPVDVGALLGWIAAALTPTRSGAAPGRVPLEPVQ